jgi:regulatory protein
VLAKLKDQRLLDDLAFACVWRDNRTQFSPRSRYLTSLELRHKGVSATTIDEVVVTIDDTESAYQAARDRLSRVPQDDYQLFRRRLGDFLRRRGFNYGVIAPTIARLWQESSTDKRSQLP